MVTMTYMCVCFQAIVHAAYVQSQGEDESTTDDDDSDEEDDGFVCFEDDDCFDRQQNNRQSPGIRNDNSNEIYDGFNSFNGMFEHIIYCHAESYSRLVHLCGISKFFILDTGKRLNIATHLTQQQLQIWNGTFDSAWKSILVSFTPHNLTFPPNLSYFDSTETWRI